MEACPKCNSLNIVVKTIYEYFDVFECNVCEYWTYQRIEDCCRNPFPVVSIDRKNDNLSFIYRQCIHCGGSLNRTKPLSFKKYGEEIRSEFSTSRFKDWHKNKQIEQELLKDLKKSYVYYNSPKYKYYLYLISPEWKEKRELVYKRDNHICQICFKKSAEDVHHLTYENLGNENLSDLISICRNCHMEIHRAKNPIPSDMKP